jgi:hypothetical protein
MRRRRERIALAFRILLLLSAWALAPYNPAAWVLGFGSVALLAVRVAWVRPAFVPRVVALVILAGAILVLCLPVWQTHDGRGSGRHSHSFFTMGHIHCRCAPDGDATATRSYRRRTRPFH